MVNIIEHNEILISGFPNLCPLHNRQPYDEKNPEIEWTRYNSAKILSAPGNAIGTYVTGYDSMIKCPECGAFTDDLGPMQLPLKEARKLKKLLKELNEKS